MTIQIQQPELEALIEQRMATGHFRNVEDVLLAALKYSAEFGDNPKAIPPKQNLARFLFDSPLRNSGLEWNRTKDDPRPVDL